MSNLNCRWATAEEMARIVEGGLVPEVPVAKRLSAKAAADLEAAPEPVTEAEPEVAVDIAPQFSWAAMISPPRQNLLGTEKVFALMGPRDVDEGEARQVDISQPEHIPVQLGTPSKWRWQRLGADIVLLGSGVTQWAKLREATLTHHSGPLAQP